PPSVGLAKQNANIIIGNLAQTLLGNLSGHEIDAGVLSRKVYLARHIGFNVNRYHWIPLVIAGIILSGMVLGFTQGGQIASVYLLCYFLALLFLPVLREDYL